MSSRSACSVHGYDIPPEALALAQAVQAWKAKTGRPFPTWSECWAELRPILLSMGWVPPQEPHKKP